MKSFLDQSYESVVRDYYVNAMHFLIRSGLKPTTIADIAAARLDVVDGDQSTRAAIHRNSYWSSDAVALPLSKSQNTGEFVIDWDSKYLRGNYLSPGRESVWLQAKEYDSLSGPRFKIINITPTRIRNIKTWGGDKYFALLSDKFEDISGKLSQGSGDYVPEHNRDNSDYWLAQLYELGATPINVGYGQGEVVKRLGITEVDGKKIDEVKNSDLWLALMRGDPRLDSDDPNNTIAIGLRDDYSDSVFAELSGEPSDKKAMGIRIHTEDGRWSTIRPWSISFIGQSDAKGDNNIWKESVRLIGVGDKVSIPTYMPEDIESAREALAAMKGVIDPRTLRPLEDLIEKL